MTEKAPEHTGPSQGWDRAAAEFAGNAVFYQALADAAREYARPLYGHLATDYSLVIARLYGEMAQQSEHFADIARELAFAESHRQDVTAAGGLIPCQDDCPGDAA